MVGHRLDQSHVEIGGHLIRDALTVVAQGNRHASEFAGLKLFFLD